MNNKTKNLIYMTREDVELLKRKLTRLIFSIEDKEGIFGKMTRQTLMEFHKKHRVNTTGIVDDKTVHLKTTDAMDNKRIVQGNVANQDSVPKLGLTWRF